MAEKSMKVNDDNFEQMVLKSDKPVLVDFWASWCHPCIVMAPIVEELADKASPQAVVAKLNVDENPKMAEKYDIMSIPTFILFEHGEAKKTAVGSMDKKKLLETFGKWLQ